MEKNIWCYHVLKIMIYDLRHSESVVFDYILNFIDSGGFIFRMSRD